jgi:hypothetical protein
MYVSRGVEKGSVQIYIGAALWFTASGCQHGHSALAHVRGEKEGTMMPWGASVQVLLFWQNSIRH